MILAIDTSIRRRVVVARVAPDGEIRESFRQDGVSAADVAAAVARLLTSEVVSVVVAVGPGSYTGVRTGMAAALGVAHSRGLPIHGVGSLEVIASGGDSDAEGEGVRALSDAGRDAFFMQEFTRHAATTVVAAGPPSRCTRADLAALPPVAVTVSADAIDGVEVVVVDPVVALVRAAVDAARRDPLDPASLAAVYVAAPLYAEVARPKQAG